MSSAALEHEIAETEHAETSVARGEERIAPPPPVEDRPSAPTPISEWKRADKAELLELPDGNVALLKRPSVMEQLRHGEIPNPLLDVALNVAQGEPLEDYEAAAEFLAFAVASAFVDPKVSIDDEPEDGALPISALSDADRQFVLRWIQTGVAKLQPFREDGAGAASGGDGGGVRDEAE